MTQSFRNSRFLAVALKYFARAHIWVYQRTNGRLGAKLLTFPAALITTTGRKSGQQRTTPTLYLRDGDRVVLPVSFGGRDGKPGWYHNLKADPKVQEREHYWERLTDMYPEDATGNFDLLDAVPFLARRMLQPPTGAIDRRFLSRFTVRIYESAEVPGRSSRLQGAASRD